jgi:glutamate synthase domain-containing protein 3
MNGSLDAGKMDMATINRELRRLVSGEKVSVRNASHISGLGAGLRRGNIHIEGDAGDYIAMLNSGADFEIKGNCGRFLGDGMISGSLIVNGNAGEGAGEYCYGGEIRIMGDAGNFIGTMNKGASILVSGNVGDDVATYMLAGEIIILGNAGKNLGNFLIGGTIYILGQVESLGNNTKLDKLRSDDVDRLARVIKKVGMREAPRQFNKIVPKSSKPFYKKREDEKGVR